VVSTKIGDKLRELRKKKGVTQSEVAQAIGVPLSTYNAWEIGENIPRDEAKVKLAEYYNRTVGFIFFK
jgi:transcriptional regulator with XRE-family HTH domain